MIFDPNKVTPGKWISGDQYENRWTVPAINKKIEYAGNVKASTLSIEDDPTRDGNKQRYQEDTFLWEPSSTITEPVVKEICRFAAEEGRIGVVRGFWQWGEVSTGPIVRSLFSTDIASPYDARLFLRNGIDVVWQLRLSYGVISGDLVQISGSAASPLGDGYRELPNWSDIRFPWGTNAPVFWTVPTNHTLRLFIKINTGISDINSIGGRMWGYTQAINKASQYNTRHGWEW